MKITKKIKRTKLEKEIDQVLEELSYVSAGSEEYEIIVKNLAALYEVKGKEKTRNSIAPDTLAVVAGNLLGIIMILGYEKANVITSKALGFVLKGRV